MFCLLALPRAHRAVRKSALFLASIRSYLKSPSQPCNCDGLLWRPPDFQLRQRRVLFRPAVVLGLLGDGFPLLSHVSGWVSNLEADSGPTHHICGAPWKLVLTVGEGKPLGEGLITIFPPALQSSFLCCGWPVGASAVSTAHQSITARVVERRLDLTEISPE